MKEYGGYIELECCHGKMLHEEAIALNCGRNALAYLCEAKRVKKLYSFEELEKAYQYAYDLSVEKRVIIEKYIQDEDKVDFYYLAENGNLTLLTSCDTVNAQNNDGSRVVQTAWLYPEKYQSSYNSKVKDNIEAMIRGMKIENGCIFFSGFIDKNQNFVFFECGYRLEGAHQ